MSVKIPSSFEIGLGLDVDLDGDVGVNLSGI